MPLTPPPAVNYPSPLYFLPNNMLGAYGRPKEGAGSISVEIDWGSMGGTDQCVSLNPGSSVTNAQQLSQIAAIYVDNSASQVAVEFVFTDTGLTIPVPAFSGGLFPVVSNSLSFFVVAVGAGAIATDVTRFLILNVNPPPVQIAQPSLMQETAVFDNIAAAAGTTAIVGAGIDGTLRGAIIGVALGATGGNWMTWQLKDGDGNVLLGGQFADSATASGMATNGQILSASGLDLPFFNGLNLVLALVTGAGFATHSAVSVNVQYETP